MSMLQDVRLAFRLFRRNLVASGIALLSIALSVAATAVVFAAIKSVLIDPLPYSRPEELVQIGSEFPKAQEQSHDPWAMWNDAQEVIRRTRTLESVAVYRNAIFDLAGDTGNDPGSALRFESDRQLVSCAGRGTDARAEHPSRGGSTGPPRRDDSELRLMGAPL